MLDHIMTTRREFIASAAAAAAPAQPAPPRPNIIFLMADQHRFHAMGCSGNPDVKTPHIDRLAGGGAFLENTFANTPVCCPARANILTGQYAHTNGMVANDLRLREGSVSAARIFASAGYRTGFIGKWHLDGGPRQPGFVPPGPRRQGFEFWAANECSHNHFDNTYFRDSPEPLRLGKFESEGWTDLGIEFLNASRTDGRPFFMTIQWGPPHDPYVAPKNYRAMYDADKLTLRPNYQSAPRVPTRDELAHYYAMVTSIDDQVGRIVGHLDHLGIRRDTIILYSSDHGDMLGSHGLRLKRKPWEESIRLPGIFSCPGRIKPGLKPPAFFTHVDFAPTLLSLAGLKPHPAMQGADLSAHLTGASSSGPDSAYFAIHGRYDGDATPAAWRGLRTPTHMYARFEDKPWVLYDLQKDPYQLKNLAGETSAAALLKDMDLRLQARMRETRDSWSNDWKGLPEDAGRLYRHKTFYTVAEYEQWARSNPEP